MGSTPALAEEYTGVKGLPGASNTLPARAPRLQAPPSTLTPWARPSEAEQAASLQRQGVPRQGPGKPPTDNGSAPPFMGCSARKEAERNK